MKQLHLLSQFFAAAPQTAQIDDIGKAQLLVTTLGAVHAIVNPIGFWQSIKSGLSFLGNRKGQLTPVANAKILSSITASCSTDVAVAVKSHMLQRSKQVKMGIKTLKSPHKSFTNFGLGELTVLSGMENPMMVDLTEVKGGSEALDVKTLTNHKEGNRIHRNETLRMESEAKKQITEMVNPVDEDAE